MGHIWIRALGLVPVCKIGLIYGNYWDSEPFSFCSCYLATFSDSSCSCAISLPSTFFFKSIAFGSHLCSFHITCFYSFTSSCPVSWLHSSQAFSPPLFSALPSPGSLWSLCSHAQGLNWMLEIIMLLGSCCGFFLCFYHPNTQLCIFFCLPPSLTHIFFSLGVVLIVLCCHKATQRAEP